MALAKSVEAPAPSLYDLPTASGECTIRVALPPPDGRIYASEPKEASMRAPREPVARLLGRHVFLGPLSAPQEGFAPYSDIHVLNELRVQLCQSTLNIARKPLQKLASLKESLEVLRTLSPDDSEIIQYRQELTYLIQQVITDDKLDAHTKRESIEAIPQADPAEVEGLRQQVAEWIQSVLDDDRLDVYTKREALEALPQADAAEVEGLRQQVAEWIQSVLDDDRLDVYTKEAAIKSIPQADPAKIAGLIHRVLGEDKLDLYAKEDAIKSIPQADPAEVAGLIHRVLGEDKLNVYAKRAAIEAIPQADPAEVAGLIHRVLGEDKLNVYAKRAAIEAIPQADPAEVAGLIHRVLGEDKLNVYAKRAAIEAIPQADPAEVEGLRQQVAEWIQSVLDDDRLDVYTKREALEAIPQADPAEVAGLIHRVLGEDKLNVYAKRAAIEAIPQADPAEVEGLRQQVAEWIQSVLDDDRLDVYTKEAAIKSIPQADPAKIAGLIHRVLGEDKLDLYAKEDAIEAIPQADAADIDSLYLRAQQCIDSITEEKIDFTRSPLHHNASSNGVVNFEKTGTETFVLPEAEDAAVRVIPRVAAANWLKAFSDWPTWYEAGFNYVPVEDVLSITPIEPPTEMLPQVAVTTSILHGISLKDYKRLSSQRHIKELTTMRDKIKLILTDMGIDHGHDHDGNFVVVPYVDDSGEVDWSRVPRLYVIDFDQSRSTSSPQYTL